VEGAAGILEEDNLPTVAALGDMMPAVGTTRAMRAMENTGGRHQEKLS
jgi:hypothetical protein